MKRGDAICAKARAAGAVLLGPAKEIAHDGKEPIKANPTEQASEDSLPRILERALQDVPSIKNHYWYTQFTVPSSRKGKRFADIYG